MLRGSFRLLCCPSLLRIVVDDHSVFRSIAAAETSILVAVQGVIPLATWLRARVAPGTRDVLEVPQHRFHGGIAPSLVGVSRVGNGEEGVRLPRMIRAARHRRWPDMMEVPHRCVQVHEISSGAF